PTMAMRGPAGSGSTRGSGPAARTPSRSSATPRPCSADTGKTRANPRAEHSATRSSTPAPSTLLAAIRTGRPDRPSVVATSRPAGDEGRAVAPPEGLALLPLDAGDGVGVGGRVDPPRIHRRRLPALELDGAVEPVPGHAGHVAHERLPPPHQAVEQSGFAHVG